MLQPFILADSHSRHSTKGEMPRTVPGKESPLQQPRLGGTGWGTDLWGLGGQPNALAPRMASSLPGCTDRGTAGRLRDVDYQTTSRTLDPVVPSTRRTSISCSQVSGGAPGWLGAGVLAWWGKYDHTRVKNSPEMRSSHLSPCSHYVVLMV